MLFEMQLFMYTPAVSIVYSVCCVQERALLCKQSSWVLLMSDECMHGHGHGRNKKALQLSPAPEVAVLLMTLQLMM